MNWRFWELKHTVATVARRLASGLRDGSISLGIADAERQEDMLTEKLVATEMALFLIPTPDDSQSLSALEGLNALEKELDEAVKDNAIPSATSRVMILKAKLWRRRFDYLRADSDRLQALERAIDFLSKSIDTDPQNDRAWYNRACYNWILGRKDEALRDLKRALQLAETPIDEDEPFARVEFHGPEKGTV